MWPPTSLSTRWQTRSGSSKPGLPPSVASRAIVDLFKLQVDLLAPTGELVARATEQAHKYGITVYDAAYMALGEALGVEVITADDELYTRAEASGFLRKL